MIEEVTVLRSDLAGALRHASECAEPKSGIEILSAVALAARSGSMTLRTCNLDRAMRVAVPCDGVLNDVAVPFEWLRAAVDGLCEGPVSLTVEGPALRIKGRNGGTRKMPLMRIDQFPIGLDGDLPLILETTAAKLLAALSFVQPAQGNDIAKPFLAGVYADRDDGRLTLVATSGFVFLRERTAIPAEGSPAIWPREFVGTAIDLLKAGGTARVYQSDRMVRLEVGVSALTSKLLDFEYPQYRRAIPLAGPSILTVDAVELLRAITSASQLVDSTFDGHRPVAVQLGSAVEVSGIGRVASAVEPVSDARWEAADLRYGVSARFLTNALKGFGDTTVDLAFRGADDPTVITAPTQPTRDAAVWPRRL